MMSHSHAATVALYFMYYNFARVHQTLRVTPAMEAGMAGVRISPSRPILAAEVTPGSHGG